MQVLTSLSPTYLSSSSGPLTEMKLAPLSLAIAFASSVLPHPGGPKSITPAGIDKPSWMNFSGWLMGSTIDSWSSFRISCSAPMSFQLTSGTVAKPSRFADGWTVFTAERKSDIWTESGAIWASVRGPESGVNFKSSLNIRLIATTAASFVKLRSRSKATS